MLGPLTCCHENVPSAGEPCAVMVNSDFSIICKSAPALTDVSTTVLSLSPPPPPHALSKPHEMRGIKANAFIRSTLLCQIITIV